MGRGSKTYFVHVDVADKFEKTNKKKNELFLTLQEIQLTLCNTSLNLVNVTNVLCQHTLLPRLKV